MQAMPARWLHRTGYVHCLCIDMSCMCWILLRVYLNGAVR